VVLRLGRESGLNVPVLGRRALPVAVPTLAQPVVVETLVKLNLPAEVPGDNFTILARKFWVRGGSMTKLISALLSAVLLAFGVQVAPAGALEPAKRFGNCEAVWKTFPRGIAASPAAARKAVRNGFRRPQVRKAIFKRNRSLAQNRVVCAVLVPETPPSQPPYFNVTALGAEAGLTAWWQASSSMGRSPVTYDIYLNGVLYSTDNGLITETNGAVDIKGLRPSTSYSVGIVARNAAGASPMLTMSQSTRSADQVSNPGRVPVVYSITGSASAVDVTLENDTNGTSQFGDVVNPSYTYWMRPGSFVYISAQNQGATGEVTCAITSQGRVVAKSTSSGAYAIATCSGRL